MVAAFLQSLQVCLERCKGQDDVVFMHGWVAFVNAHAVVGAVYGFWVGSKHFKLLNFTLEAGWRYIVGESIGIREFGAVANLDAIFVA